MKVVKNLFLMCVLFVAASVSYAQEIKPIRHDAQTNKVIEQRNQQPEKHPKHKKVQSDLRTIRVKPMKIESRIYNESN
jgi:hypothetical protein